MSRYKPVLLLDYSYQPLEIIHWKRAIKILFSSEVDVLEEYSDLVRSPSTAIKLPAVMRLKSEIKRGHWTKYRRSFFQLKPNKKSLFARDNGRCAYCKKSLTYRESTLDHIVPKSHGGDNSWANLTIACQDCNHNKGNKKKEKVFPNADLSSVRDGNVDRIKAIESTIKIKYPEMPTEWLFYFQKG
jgi:5-methylcytosine-specific restriction endonuclease McrA